MRAPRRAPRARIRLTAFQTGWREIEDAAARVTDHARRRSRFVTSSATRNAENSGHQSTTSRSCVSATHQSRPFGQGATVRNTRLPLASRADSRSRTAANDTTGTRSTAAATSAFSALGTRPKRSATLDRCSATRPAISVTSDREPRGIRTQASSTRIPHPAA